jgi:hypothetical protein
MNPTLALRWEGLGLPLPLASIVRCAPPKKLDGLCRPVFRP